MRNRVRVAVLGATGSVGQRFVQLLGSHPWFELAAVTGSPVRVGKRYADTCRWILSEPMPENVRNMAVVQTEPDALDAELVFCALPSDVAREKEPLFARAGMGVCTNAGAYRREPDVPVLLPEVNPDHIRAIAVQRKNRDWDGFIVTNPNCTSTGMTVVLKAIHDAFGLEKVMAFSMQATSGAGYPGVPSLDIVDNVIPFINGEEGKVEWEPRKMLGRFNGSSFDLADFQISAHTNRVTVLDGHLVCLTLKLRTQAPPEAVEAVLASYTPPVESRNLPSCPSPVIVVRREPDRPQPRLDRMTGNGMSTVVGRVRPDTIFDIRLAVLSHNTIRGAAGGSLFNAELMVAQGLTRSR